MTTGLQIESFCQVYVPALIALIYVCHIAIGTDISTIDWSDWNSKIAGPSSSHPTRFGILFPCFHEPTIFQCAQLLFRSLFLRIPSTFSSGLQQSIWRVDSRVRSPLQFHQIPHQVPGNNFSHQHYRHHCSYRRRHFHLLWSLPLHHSILLHYLSLQDVAVKEFRYPPSIRYHCRIVFQFLTLFSFSEDRRGYLDLLEGTGFRKITTWFAWIHQNPNWKVGVLTINNKTTKKPFLSLDHWPTAHRLRFRGFECSRIAMNVRQLPVWPILTRFSSLLCAGTTEHCSYRLVVRGSCYCFSWATNIFKHLRAVVHGWQRSKIACRVRLSLFITSFFSGYSCKHCKRCNNLLFLQLKLLQPTSALLRLPRSKTLHTSLLFPLYISTRCPRAFKNHCRYLISAVAHPCTAKLALGT